MAQVLWKKRDGILKLSGNSQQLTWTAASPPGSMPELTVLVPNITNLQQTPPDKPKVMLKLTAQSQNNIEPIVHTFTFTSATEARAQADKLKDSLRTAITDAQQAAANSSTMEVTGGGAPGAMAISSALQKAQDSSSDKNLMQDFHLQQALLKADPILSNTFRESMRTKPESISNAQFANQFWSSRLNQLRAYATEQGQSKGGYNVLASIKSFSDAGRDKLNITQEQIRLIFTQFKMVRDIYNELVERAFDIDGKTKLSSPRFWTRFFQSRLLKNLKGERITDADPEDKLLDEYLKPEKQAKLLDAKEWDVFLTPEAFRKAHEKKALDEKKLEEWNKLQNPDKEPNVPHFMDLEGNEQNHSQRKGNAPDLLMRPAGPGKVPLMRRLNWMSGKILSQVAPHDVDPSEPIGMDEETFNELALRDLQLEMAESRVILNVKDRGRFFSSGKDTSTDTDLLAATKITPAQLLQNLKASVSKSNGESESRQKSSFLASSIGINPDSDSSSSEDEDPNLKKPAKPSQHFSSRRALTSASTQIFALVAEQRAQNPSFSNIKPSNQGADASLSSSQTPLNPTATPLDPANTNLSQGILERVSLLQGSTTEFLSYFWKSFLSGDPAKAAEVASLASTVEQSLARIEQVAADAETERTAEVEKKKKMAAERARRLGRKVAGFDEGSVGGGRKGVEGLMAGTLNAVKGAVERYKEVLEAQKSALAAAAAEG
ncbi:RNA polymerase II transcription factor B subunit 1 [Thelotrema lepadinum]|nr:RNA polymerase II transcription factor B subunit 1 [Thelotrema lepadinum]